MTTEQAKWKTYSEYVFGDYRLRVDREDKSETGDWYNIMVYFMNEYLDHDFCRSEELAKYRGLEVALKHQLRQKGIKQ